MIARISSDAALIGVVAGVPTLVALVVVLWTLPGRRTALAAGATLVAAIIVALLLLVVFRTGS
jgi:hypothetical protein